MKIIAFIVVVLVSVKFSFAENITMGYASTGYRFDPPEYVTMFFAGSVLLFIASFMRKGVTRVRSFQKDSAELYKGISVWVEPPECPPRIVEETNRTKKSTHEDFI